MELNETKAYIFNKDEINRMIANYLKIEIGVKINEATVQFHWTGDRVTVKVKNTSKTRDIS